MNLGNNYWQVHLVIKKDSSLVGGKVKDKWEKIFVGPKTRQRWNGVGS